MAVVTAVIAKAPLVLPKLPCLLSCHSTARALQTLGVKVFLDPRDTFLLIQEFGYRENHCPLLPEKAQIDYMSQILIRYTPPAGTLGAAFAKLFQENPELEIADDLRRFKSLIEAGEVPTTTGQPTGTSSPLGRFDASDVIESLH